MQTLLAESTAQYPLGIGSGSKLFHIEQGQYAGRMVALYQASGNEIKLCWADYPYKEWSVPQTVVNGAGDFPFDAALLHDNAVSIVYNDSGGNTLLSTKLLFVQGNWVPLSAVTVHDQDINGNPNLMVEPEGKLWAVWCRDTGSGCYVNAKNSIDGGTTWSNMIEITTCSSSAVPKAIADGRFVYMVYALDGNRLAYTYREFYALGFEDEREIINSNGIEGDFDLAVSDSGRIGLVFNDGQLRFIEFDGESWSSAAVVDGDGGGYPQVQYSGNIPYVVYLSPKGNGRTGILYRNRPGSSFSEPAPIEPGQGIFDRVLLYESGTGSYEDLTAEASEDTTGDIFHTESSALLSQTGDTLYLGMADKFNFIRFILSTGGAGGSIGWTYHNGNDWYGFTPEDGVWDFADIDKSLLLWPDLSVVPSDWQRTEVQGEKLYWIRIAVTSSFATGPVGTQIGSIPDNSAIVLLE